MQGVITKTFILLFLINLTRAQVSSINPVCSLCHDVVREFQKTIPRRPAQAILDLIGTTYCTKKHIQKHNVCKGAVTQMMDSIVNSAWKHYTDPHSVCHKLRLCPKQYILRNLTKEIQQILSNKPVKEWENPTKRKILKVMHISDLHPDLYYTVGAQTKCSEPVCCRSNVTMKLDPWKMFQDMERGHFYEVSQNAANPAGYWGSIAKCDLPIQTFNLFIEELSKINPDMIIWTGDNTPHDIWQQTQSYNLNFTFMETQKMKKVTNAKIVAAMGNHESYPVNVYDYEGERQKVLIGGLAEAWKPWLTQQAYDMLRTKGYFSLIIPEFNNLKVISVNTQAQNDQNWYLLRNPTDAGGMLKWIQEELKSSQKIGQFVYIIGHISPRSALNEWSMRFNALTDRYSYTIRGQFYGHTHDDHVGFFPTFSNHSRLSNYFLIAPSLTTYSGKNPQYRIMQVDYDTLQVINYDQYVLDLKKYQKKQDKAKFEKLYNFQQAYGVSDMTVRGGMSEFMNKLKNDKQTQIKYSHYMNSGLDNGHAGKDVFCDTMTSDTFNIECMGAAKQKKKNLFDRVAGPWKDLKHQE